MPRHIQPDGKHATPEFAVLLGTLAETLGQRFSATRIVLYARLLDDLTLAEVATACERAAREGSGFLPSPGELRRYVRPSADEAAVLIWNGLAHAADVVGAYAPLAFDDPAAAEAVRAVFGGWPEVCAECDGGPGWAARRQEFIAVYKMAARLAPKADAPRVLPGLVGLPASGTVAQLTTGGEVRELPATALVRREEP